VRFRNRAHAAQLLIAQLADYRGVNPLVIGIPRGGVPMARQVADALEGELDVILVRKLGMRGNPEFAVGAVSEDGQILRNPHLPPGAVDEAYLEQEAAAQLELIRARRARYAPSRDPVDPNERVVILVDDGTATGSTMIAALRALRPRRARELVAALPVAPPETAARLRREADRLVVLATPDDFRAVGAYYDDFGQVSDEDVVAALGS